MRISSKIYFFTGLFITLVFIAIAYTVTIIGLNKVTDGRNTYVVSAVFNNVGSLKIGSSIKIGGVQIGKVTKIGLDKDYQPQVFIVINTKYNKIPSSSILSIKTNGIIGDQFLDLQLGFDDGQEDYLINGSQFSTTNGAIIIEDLIGKYLYNKK